LHRNARCPFGPLYNGQAPPGPKPHIDRPIREVESTSPWVGMLVATPVAGSLVVARGYRPIEISNVLVQPIDEPGRVHAHPMASRESRGVKASRTRSRDTCVAVGVRTAAQVSQIRRGTCLA